MARYDSSSTVMEGQYPATAWSSMGLPAQGEQSGAPGSSGPGDGRDTGGTTQAGQYPSRETFSGVPLDGTGAPGTSGVAAGTGANSGPDSVAYTRPTFYKSASQDGGIEQGYPQSQASGSVSGTADWTQANSESYGPGHNMPGIEGNTPTPNSGPYQPGSGRVLRGGYMRGQR